jgi:hypothetical protein
VKRSPELTSPASFSSSGGTHPPIEERNGSHIQKKTGVRVQQTIREGKQRLHERAAKDLFIHDTMSWMDLVHQLDARARTTASGCPMVVMVQPTYSGNSDHLVACMMRGHG